MVKNYLILAVLSTTVFSGTLVEHASASETTTKITKSDRVPYISEDDYDRYLAKSGYPQEVITLLELEQKKKIYEEKAVYASHKKNVGYLNGNPSVSPFETVGTEQMNNFDATLVASRVTTPSAYGKVEFLLDYNWTWNQEAAFNLMDKFGIAWSDDFDAYPTSAVYSYRAYGKSLYGNVLAEKTTGLVYTYEKYTTAGIGWEYDIWHDWMDLYHTYIVYRHKGWGQVKIGRWSNKSGLNEQTSAVAAYFHKQGSTTGSFGFSPLPSISLEGSTDYDKTDDKAANPFTWNHYKY